MLFFRHQHKAFSSFELLCVVVIFALLASLGVRYLGNLQEKNCILHLKSKLALAQHELSSYYSSTFMLSLPPQGVRARAILASHFDGHRQCGLELKERQVVAYIGSSRLVFTITPPTFDVNPKITCNLKERLCKEMSDRILDK